MAIDPERQPQQISFHEFESRTETRVPEFPQVRPVEKSPRKEVLVPLVDVITISGYSGTGKTTLGHLLEKMYRRKFWKVGEEFRKRYKKRTGKDVLDFADRDISVDEELDRYTAELIRTARQRRTGIIVEGRMAGCIGRKVVRETTERDKDKPDNEKDIPSVFSILLHSSDQVKIHRIRKRTNKERIKRGETPLTYKEVEQATLNRDAGDLAIFQELHKDILMHNGELIDPLDPTLVDENGNHPFYDLVINVNKPKPPEVGLLVHQDLVDKNLMARERRRKSPKVQIEIFPAPQAS